MCDVCVCTFCQTILWEKWQCSIEYLLIPLVCEIVPQKGQCFVVMWQPSISTLNSIPMSLNERPAPRERSLEETRLVCVSSVPLSQLLAASFDPSQWIIVLFWAVGKSSVGDAPLPSRKVSGPPSEPPLPPPGHNPLRVSPQPLRVSSTRI